MAYTLLSVPSSSEVIFIDNTRASESMLHTNYHTHTFRCGHAEGDAADYCRAAQEQGLSLIGFTDHSALPDNRWLNVRMHIDELPDYCNAIDGARKEFPGLTVLKGMECEFAPEYVSFFADELLGRLEFDYIIGGAHWFPHRGEWLGVYRGTTAPEHLVSYARYLVESMESGLFAFIAHPDLFCNAYLPWDANAEACAREICQAAASLRVPLEINGYGLRKPQIDTGDGMRPMYPMEQFWELAGALGVDAVITADAHRPQDVTGKMAECAALAKRCGLACAALTYLETSRPASKPALNE